ncbi:MAG: formate/nitrite transporter family protein [Clostridia bacterium]
MSNPTKTPGEIYSYTVYSGHKKAETPALRLLVQGIFGGLCIALAACSTSVAVHDVSNYGLAKLIAGFTFPIGLMLIMLAGGALFTSSCLLFLNFKDHKVTLGQFFKVISIVYISNFIGAFIIALLVSYSGQLSMSYGGLAEYAIKLANTKVNIPFSQAIASGIICNILVCSSVAFATAVTDGAGKIFAIFFSIMAFAISGVEHCVANMYYILVGIFANSVPAYSSLVTADTSNLNFANMITGNLIPVTLGNIIGGLFMCFIFYFAIRDNAEFAVSKDTTKTH